MIILLLQTLNYEEGMLISNVSAFLNIQNTHERNYTLTEDLDFQDITDYSSQPIYHTFNGNGHYISNLKITYPINEVYYGLFRPSNNAIQIINLHLKNITIYTQSTIQTDTQIAILLPFAQQAEIHNISFTDCQISISRNHQNLKTGIVVGQVINKAIITNIGITNTKIQSQLGSTNGYIAGILGYASGQVDIKNIYSDIQVESQQSIFSISGIAGYIQDNNDSQSYIDNVISQMTIQTVQQSKISGILYTSNNKKLQISNIQNKINGVSGLQDQIAGIQYQSNQNTFYKNIYTQSDTRQVLGLTIDSSNDQNSSDVYASASQIANYQNPDSSDIVTQQLTIPTYQLYTISEQSIDCNAQNVLKDCARHAMCQENHLGNVPTYYCSCKNFSLRYGNQCIKVSYEPEDEDKINQISLQNKSFLSIAIGGGIVLASSIFFNIVLMQYFKKKNLMKPISIDKSSKKSMGSFSSDQNSKSFTQKANQDKVQQKPTSKLSLRSTKQVKQPDNISVKSGKINLEPLQRQISVPYTNITSNKLASMEGMSTKEALAQLDNPEAMLNTLLQKQDFNNLYQENAQNQNQKTKKVNKVKKTKQKAPTIKTDKGSQINQTTIDISSINTQEDNNVHKQKIKKVVRKSKNQDQKKTESSNLNQ